MYTFRGLLLVSLLSGSISVSCASADHTVRPEAVQHSIATPPLVDQESRARVENTPETSERVLPVPLYAMREIIVFPLYAVTTLLIATGDWLVYEREVGWARRDSARNLIGRHCAQEPLSEC
jgi:hypothetical protein